VCIKSISLPSCNKASPTTLMRIKFFIIVLIIISHANASPLGPLILPHSPC
jgi:hypothetical protein